MSSIEDIVRETKRENLAEMSDWATKVEQLVRLGLMPVEKLPFLKRAFMHVKTDMFLPIQERATFYDFVEDLLHITLGDPGIFRLMKNKTGALRREEVELEEHIVKRGNEFVVTNKDKTKTLGTHGTRASAVKQLQAIEIAKHAHSEEVDEGILDVFRAKSDAQKKLTTIKSPSTSGRSVPKYVPEPRTYVLKPKKSVGPKSAKDFRVASKERSRNETFNSAERNSGEPGHLVGGSMYHEAAEIAKDLLNMINEAGYLIAEHHLVEVWSNDPFRTGGHNVTSGNKSPRPTKSTTERSDYEERAFAARELTSRAGDATELAKKHHPSPKHHGAAADAHREAIKAHSEILGKHEAAKAAKAEEAENNAKNGRGGGGFNNKESGSYINGPEQGMYHREQIKRGGFYVKYHTTQSGKSGIKVSTRRPGGVKPVKEESEIQENTDFSKAPVSMLQNIAQVVVRKRKARAVPTAAEKTLAAKAKAEIRRRLHMKHPGAAVIKSDLELPQDMDLAEGHTYQECFNGALEYFGVSSFDELDEKHNREFFRYVEKLQEGSTGPKSTIPLSDEIKAKVAQDIADRKLSKGKMTAAVAAAKEIFDKSKYADRIKPYFPRIPKSQRETSL